jgi:biotin carboxyl carrier protein
MDQRSATTAADSLTPSLAEQVTTLARFAGSPAQFLGELLAFQCRVVDARGAAILVLDDGDRARVLLRHPPAGKDDPPPLWLARAAEMSRETLDADRARIVPLSNGGQDDVPSERELILLPLAGALGTRALGAYDICDGHPGLAERALERLELSAAMLSLYEVRLTASARQADLQRLRAAMEVLDAINQQSRCRSASIALCNEIAMRWEATRVSVGFLRGRYVKTAAISHTEHFDRKMRLVQALESAMEECIDQDEEVLLPAPADTAVVSRAAETLSRHDGPAAVVSLPLRHEGEAVGALVVEREAERPWRADEIETIRLTADLGTARLADLHDHDKWLGAKLADAARDGLAAVVGPRHTWLKVAAIAVLGAVLFLTLVKGPDRIDASFEIQAVERRVVPAPFAGRLQSVLVEPGDVVTEGAVLAHLDTAELQLQLAATRAERSSFAKEADLALRDGKTAEVQIAEAGLRKADAQIRLLEHRIARATIVAPVDGTVVSGELKRQVGAPLEMGQMLFEVAALGSLRAVLDVSDDRAADLFDPDRPTSQHGTLASISHPGEHIPFEIERVNPVAEVIDQRNVFRIRVQLLETRPWLRPGMTGVAKVTVGRKPYGVLWTRGLVRWVRMKLWI